MTNNLLSLLKTEFLNRFRLGTIRNERNKKVKYFRTQDWKYLTFFWKIFHYNCAELTVLYRKRKSCV